MGSSPQVQDLEWSSQFSYIQKKGADYNKYRWNELLMLLPYHTIQDIMEFYWSPHICVYPNTSEMKPMRMTRALLFCVADKWREKKPCSTP